MTAIIGQDEPVLRILKEKPHLIGPRGLESLPIGRESSRPGAGFEGRRGHGEWGEILRGDPAFEALVERAKKLEVRNLIAGVIERARSRTAADVSMSVPRSRAFAGVAMLCFALGPGPTAAPEGRLLYTRADLVEALTGQVEVRRAYTHQLRLPLPNCAEGRFACFEDAMYGQIYELAFSAEGLHKERDGSFRIDRKDRGRLLVALDLSKEVEDDFEEACRNEVAALSPAAFSQPQAGMRYLDGSLNQSLLDQSARPAWVCAESNGDYSCDIKVQDGAFGANGEIAERVGRTISQAVAGFAPDIIRTPPDVLAQDRTDVSFRSASSLAGRTWADRLATVPEGAKFTKQPLDGKKTGGSRDFRGEAYRGHEGRYGVSERDVLLPPASLQLLGVPMWVGEWRFETTHETFGEAPTTQHMAPISIILAVAPISDPLMDDLSRKRVPLSVPADPLIATVLALFKQKAKLDPGLVEEAAANPELWPGVGDWLVIGCRDDGTARYGIAPFADTARVTNPREACAAIQRDLH